LKAILAVFPILIYVFFPKNQLFPFQAIAACIFLWSSFILADRLSRGKAIPKKIIFNLVVFYCLLLSSLITLFINDVSTLRSIVQISKIIMFALILSSVAILAKSLSQRQALLILGKTSLILLIFQTVIVLTTLFSPDLLGEIWSSEKTSGLGGILRLPGTVYNPNSFGLLILNMYATLVFSPILIPKKHFTAFIWCFALVLLSGSRTSILVMLITSPVVTLLSSNFDLDILKISKVLIKMTINLSILIILLWFILQYASDYFPYISRLRFIFDQASFSDLVPIIIEQSKRGDIWQEGWRFFRDAPGLLKWFLGLGPHDIFRISDNDFMYNFWHWGLIGSFFIYSSYLLVLFQYNGARNALKKVTLVVFIQLLVSGLMIETFSSWFHPIFFWVTAGLMLGCNKRKEFRDDTLAVH
jgi:hypothetical protein